MGVTPEGTLMPRLATAAFVLALSAAAAPAFAASAEVTRYDRDFPTTGRPTLILRSDDASVHVTTWDRQAVGIRVTTRGWSLGAPALTVSASQSGDRVLCEVREPHRIASFVIGVRVIRVDLRLPRDADLDVSTGDGAIVLAPLAGEIRAHSGDGAIEADGLCGELTLTTGDGHIRASALDGSLVARSGDGSITLDGRFDRLEVGTSDGRVSATAREGSRLASAWDLHSGDGGLTLRVPATLRADLDLRTGDGHVTVDLPVEVSGRMERHTVFGRMNGGGPLLRMRCGDGSIRLERL
jgi:hypothetical protein